MPENSKDEWEEIIRSDVKPSNLFVVHSISNSNQFLGGPRYEKLLVYTEGGTGYYYENFKDHHLVGEYCLSLFLKDKGRLQEYLRFWNLEFEKLNKIFERIRATDLKKLSDSGLTGLIEEVYRQAIYWHGMAYNVDAIDEVFVPKIQRVIEDCFPNERKSRQAEIFNKITFPQVLSYVNRIGLEKLELFNGLNSNPIEAKKMVPEFVNRYYWVNFKWGESEEYALRDFWAELQKADLKMVSEGLLETKKRFEIAWKEKNALLKSIAEKRPIMLEYAGIFEAYSVLHDLRKEGQLKTVHFLTAIYNELALRLKIKSGLLSYYWPLELIQAVKSKKPDIALLEKRKKRWLYEYWADGRSEEFFGKAALERRNKEIGLGASKPQKEIQGTSASQGRIIGKAKICLSAKSAAEKISEGDILVTGMTMPDFVVSMGKAGAIVTDEGGLTCHAAIIARELGKPCVVGTRIATRLIRDNDLLEVNANHGIVKILKTSQSK